METLYCRIHGRVQMVMFRDFTTRKARSVGIVGYVRNMPDGSVEAYAVGKRDDLKYLLEKLRRGPLFAHVERVDVQWNAELPKGMQGKTFDSFDIVF